jgi:hypothetical protein
MDKFLDTYDHSKLNKEDINHLNRSIMQNEIEAAIKKKKKKEKLVQERAENTLEVVGVSKDFLNRTLAAQLLRERMDKWDFIKLKSFYTIKEWSLN